MDLPTIVTLVAAIGGPAGLVALIMVLPQIRKLQADTEKVEREADLSDIDGATRLSTAALGQMQAALERAHRAEDHANALEGRVRCLERAMAAYADVAQEHVAWDMQRILQLQDMGEEVTPAPPLLPPLSERTTIQ